MPQTSIDWLKVQKRLGKLYPYKADGLAREHTWIGVVGFAAPSADPGGNAVTLRGRKLAEVQAEFQFNTAERIAGFLSNTSHETGDYSKLRESLYYTDAGHIRDTWPSRFARDADAAPYVRHEQALANFVYARNHEGNTRPGDGWLFRGGGDLQTTFANGFRATGQDLALPLYDHPELIESPSIALLAGLSYWRRNEMARFYDAGTPKRGRALANAGDPDYPNPIGWPDVQSRHNRLMELLTP